MDRQLPSVRPDTEVRFQPEAAFKCKRHSLNAPFVGALIESKWFG